MGATSIVLCVSSFPTSARPDTIKVGGTGGAEAIVRQLGETFERQTGIAIRIIPGLGSSGGLRALADGVVDIAIGGQHPDATQARKGIAIAFSGRTPLVLATSNRSPGGFHSAEVAGIIRSTTAKWPDATPIRIILRSVSATETISMGKYFPGAAAALEFARKSLNFPVAGNDSDAADLAEEALGSLIAATYLQVVTEKRKLQFVAIDGITPTLENLENGQYPYEKVLHFFVRRPASVTSEKFLGFLLSNEALLIMRNAGLIAVGTD